MHNASLNPTQWLAFPGDALKRALPFAWVLLAVCATMIVQKWLRYGGSANYNLGLSVIYNLVSVLPFFACLLAGTVLAERFRDRGLWRRAVAVAVSCAVLLAMYVVTVSLLLYWLGLATSPLSSPFFAKYASGLVHLHVALYLAIHLLPPSLEPGTGSRCESRQARRVFGIPVASVLRVESANHYVWIHTTDGSQLERARMSDLEDRFSDHFVRVHRSHLVNRRQITRVIKRGRKMAVLVGGSQVPVSKRYQGQIAGLALTRSRQI